MKKLIIILALLLLPAVYASVQNFPNTITVITINNTVNITTEEDSRVFSCNSTSSSNYIFNLKRNISDAVDLTNTLGNLTSNVNHVFTTCDKITQAYGDINRYYALYSTCNTDNELCKKDRDDKQAKLNEFTPYRANYDTCNTNLGNAQTENQRLTAEVIPSMQTNMTICQADLDKSDKGKVLWFAVGALVVAVFWTIERKKMNPVTRKGKMSVLGGRQ